MVIYKHGDYVKFDIRDERRGESECLWLKVDRVDDQMRVVFGTLANMPVVRTDMHLGQRLAVSYDNIRRHAKPEEFETPLGGGPQMA